MIIEGDPKALAQRLDKVLALAAIYAPGLTGYIMLGSLVAELSPELYGMAVALLKKPEPTEAEKAEVIAAIRALANPEKL